MDDTRVLLFTLHMPVRWRDMDAVGHVNNATYFSYFEQARIAWLDSVGASDLVSTADHGPVAVNAAAEFLRSIVYPATLEVRVRGGAPGRSSFETYYEIVDGDDSGRRYATGSVKLVWVDRTTGRSTPLPERIRRLLPERPPP